tara:strand:+ start:106 stop:546 length:441 start_codon:yes stop_codon:yes gene_type:complete
MNKKVKKPYVIYMAEVIYSYISIIKKDNSQISTEEAINKFIETNDFIKLSSGKLHNQWFAQLKLNNYKDINTGEDIPKETLKLLEIQRDATIKQLVKVPELYEAKNNTLIEASKRPHQFLWRMCESYELWARETGQQELLYLKIID